MFTGIDYQAKNLWKHIMMNKKVLRFFVKEAAAYHKKILRRVRKLVSQGKLDEAQQYIDANRDFIRVTDQGSQIQHLGSGAEGVGTLVVGATDNPYKLTVRKAMDRGSPLFSQDNMAQTHNVFRRAANSNNPLFARRYSKKIKKGKRGTPYTINEYVPGSEVGLIGQHGPIAPKGSSLAPGGLSIPEAGAKNVVTDVIGNPGNILRDAAGNEKIIDFVPTTHERMRSSILASGPRANQLRKRNRIALTPKQQLTTLSDLNDPARVQEAQAAIVADTRLMQQLQNPRIAREAQAAQLSDQWGVAVQPSDIGPTGLRRANMLRTLRGL